MLPRVVLLLSILASTLAIIRVDEGSSRRRGHYGGGGHHHRHSFSSSDSDSNSNSHEHGGHRPPHRPPRPSPTPAPEWVCESGYTKYMRSDYAWCIKVVASPVLNTPAQAGAAANCVAMGAVLTGYQNDEERMGSANEALALMNNLGQLVGGMWLGANLYPGCMNPSCGPNNTYYWTDGSTSGYDGLHWGNGEPDNVDWGTGCLQQFIMSPSYAYSSGAYSVWVRDFRHGDLDKYSCTTTSPQQRLYACGKRGTLVNN